MEQFKGLNIFNRIEEMMRNGQLDHKRQFILLDIKSNKDYIITAKTESDDSYSHIMDSYMRPQYCNIHIYKYQNLTNYNSASEHILKITDITNYKETNSKYNKYINVISKSDSLSVEIDKYLVTNIYSYDSECLVLISICNNYIDILNTTVITDSETITLFKDKFKALASKVNYVNMFNYSNQEVTNLQKPISLSSYKDLTIDVLNNVLISNQEDAEYYDVISKEDKLKSNFEFEPANYELYDRRHIEYRYMPYVNFIVYSSNLSSINNNLLTKNLNYIIAKIEKERVNLLECLGKGNNPIGSILNRLYGNYGNRNLPTPDMFLEELYSDLRYRIYNNVINYLKDQDDDTFLDNLKSEEDFKAYFNSLLGYTKYSQKANDIVNIIKNIIMFLLGCKIVFRIDKTKDMIQVTALFVSNDESKKEYIKPLGLI